MAERFVLRLYVAGATPGSARAIEVLKDICDCHLPHSCDLQIIDVYQQPQLALDEQIDAVPILVKRSPAPPQRILGDLSDKNYVLRRLQLSSRT